MEIVIAQTTFSQSIQRRCIDWATKRGGRTKTDVVNQNDDDVGRTLGRLNSEQGWRLDVAHVQLLEFGWVRLSKWQVCAIYLIGLQAGRCGNKIRRKTQAAGAFKIHIDAHTGFP